MDRTKELEELQKETIEERSKMNGEGEVPFEQETPYKDEPDKTLIEEIGKTAVTDAIDIWGITENVTDAANSVRPLQKVQPISTYGKALAGNSELQGHLFSAFEFARANI